MPAPSPRLDGRVLHCVIATADNGNALDMDAVVEAADAVAALDADEVGAVLVGSTGAHFCTGGNVRAFAGADDRAALLTGMAGQLHELVLALVAAPVPVVAAVTGWAAGAGMSLACACDIRVGGPGTMFRPGYPAIGYTPDGGLSWTLPRAVGVARARDVVLTNTVLDAEEAARLGLLTRVVPDDEHVGAEAQALAATLAAGPTAAYGRIKQLLAASPERTLADQLDAETAAIAASAASPEGVEGVDAFVAKRTPDFAAARRAARTATP